MHLDVIELCQLFRRELSGVQRKPQYGLFESSFLGLKFPGKCELAIERYVRLPSGSYLFRINAGSTNQFNGVGGERVTQTDQFVTAAPPQTVRAGQDDSGLVPQPFHQEIPASMGTRDEEEPKPNRQKQRYRKSHEKKSGLLRDLLRLLAEQAALEQRTRFVKRSCISGEGR